MTACDVLFFGPEEYVRTTGPKNVYTATVTTPAWAAPPYRMTVQNGDADGRNRVSSARVEIDGSQVIGPSDFNQGVAQLERAVDLLPASTLRVTLAGSPGGRLVIEMCGTNADHTGPQVTIAGPAPGAATNQSRPRLVVRYTDAPGSQPSSGLDLSTLAVLLDGVDRTELFTLGTAEAVAELPAALALADGVHTISATVRDLARNEGSASAEFRVDTIPPTVQAKASPLPNDAGWNQSDVAVSFDCQDTGSGVAECPAAQIVTAETAGSVVSGTARDRAGNSATASTTIKLDRTPPTITASVSPTPVDGWNKSDVTLTFECADALSGVATCSPPVTLTTDGTHTVTGTAADTAGNAGTVSLTVALDKASPTITASAAPAANSHGWNTSAVVVSFACADAGSGVADCPEPMSVPNETAGQNVSGTVRDRAGNSATASVTVRLDATAPTITAALSAAPNAAGWHQTDVTVTFACADALSGIESCPEPVVVGTEGAGQVVSGAAVDKAGNTASTSVTLNVDKAAPLLAVTEPAEGAIVKISPTEVRGTVSDALSGVASVACNGHPATVSGGGFTCSVPLELGGNGLAVVATDAAGHATSQTVHVTYQPNNAPTAHPGGPYGGDVGEVIAFDGSQSSDPDGDALTYRWSFGDGGSGAGRNAVHAYDAVGTFTVALTVDDGRGGTDTQSTQATIKPLNQRPTARFTAPADGEVGSAVVFDGTGSDDPDQDSLTFSWSFGDGETAAGASVSHTYAAAQSFTVTLMVDDGRPNGQHATSASIAIKPRNRDPVSRPGGPYEGFVGDPIAFDGSASSDEDQDPLTYRWTFGDGGSASGAQASHTYRTAGTFAATLVVEDGRSGSGSQTASVTISVAPPRPPRSQPGGPYQGEAGQDVLFDGSASSDPDGQALTYAWDFGDGTSGSGPRPSHAYAAAGDYGVTLTVTDTDNSSDSASTSITVTPVADRSPPVLTLAGPRQALPGTTALFVAQASDNVAVASVTFEVNGADPLRLDAPPYERTLTIPPVVSPGTTYAVKATARDAAGNAASEEILLTVVLASDEEKPVVFLNRPPEAAPGSTIHFSAEATDNVAVSAVTFLIKALRVSEWVKTT